MTTEPSHMNLAESPVKHTSAGELPDTSSSTRIVQRMRDWGIVMSDRGNLKTLLPQILLSALVVGGTYLFWKWTQRSDNWAPDELY